MTADDDRKPYRPPTLTGFELPAPDLVGVDFLIDAEDWDNVHFALGIAAGALLRPHGGGGPIDDVDRRAAKRLIALQAALADGKVRRR